VPYRTFEGNRPSNVLLVDGLTPDSLGRPVGVELGKVLANRIMPERSPQEPKLGHDSSMDALPLAGGLKIEVLGHAP